MKACCERTHRCRLMSDAARLIGAWRLRHWVALADDGSESQPMGQEPDGLLVYSGDGTMITVLGPSERPRFESDDVTGGTDEERVRAFATYVAYGGSFTVDGDTVSAEELLRRVWDENIDPLTNTARMTVMGLRRKLGDPPVVHTVKGAGYRV